MVGARTALFWEAQFGVVASGEEIHTYLQAAGLGPDNIEATVTQATISMMRPLGSKEVGAGHTITAESSIFSFTAFALSLGTSTKEKGQSRLAAMPTAEALFDFVNTTNHGVQLMHFMYWFNPYLDMALGWEAVEGYEHALSFADAVLQLDLTHGGDMKPTSHILAHGIRGRCFAKLGRVTEARTAHEAAIGLAQEYSIVLLTAMALRDLLAVRGGAKEVVEARLGKVLAAMDGPTDKLQKVMGSSVDVAALIVAA
eukprot:SAG31_NODE_9765_length_1230_cov_1.707339_2_plen_256_part_01